MKSISDFITPSDIIAEIILKRSNPISSHYSFILLEGKSDVMVFENFIDEDQSDIIVCMGKNKVINTVELIKKQKIKGALGIIDSDYDVIDNIKHSNSFFVKTDVHDLETTILATSSFNRSLKRRIDFSKLSTRISAIDKLLTHISSEMEKLGKIRYLIRKYNHLNSTNYTIDGPNFHFQYNEKFEFNFNGFLDSLDLITPLRAYIDKNYNQLSQIKVSNWHWTRGHDVINFIRAGLRYIFYKNNNARNLSEEDLFELMVGSFNVKYFLKTRMYDGIKGWEGNNLKYKILIEI